MQVQQRPRTWRSSKATSRHHCVELIRVTVSSMDSCLSLSFSLSLFIRFHFVPYCSFVLVFCILAGLYPFISRYCLVFLPLPSSPPPTTLWNGSIHVVCYTSVSKDFNRFLVISIGLISCHPLSRVRPLGEASFERILRALHRVVPSFFSNLLLTFEGLPWFWHGFPLMSWCWWFLSST